MIARAWLVCHLTRRHRHQLPELLRLFSYEGVIGGPGARPDAPVLTGTYTINLLAPAAGPRFTMTGQVIRAGRTLLVCRGEAFADGAAAPFAVMQATITALYDRPGLCG
jgi:acyl-coenzyme A thioesterase PaaI-like protein